MLVIEIEYLTGVACAASAYDRGAAEWPPHPDRLFSALVCAWAERGQDANERAPLEWLECQRPPELAVSPAGRRSAVDVYVPPNDMRVTGKPGSPPAKDSARSLAVLPALRKNRQPRQFPAFIPEHPTATFIWRDLELPLELVDALDRLVRAVPYLGHSASLVRMSLRREPPAELSLTPARNGEMRLRCPYPGRLQELTEGYFAASSYRPFRPSRAPAVGYAMPGEGLEDVPASLFGRDWIVLADEAGEVPAIEAIAVVAGRLRQALMAHADEPIPELLSGHDRERAPTSSPHLAIVPLADVGWSYSTGRLMGLGLVLPRRIENDRDDPARRRVLAAIGRFVRTAEEGSGELRLGSLGVWRLRRQPQPEASSLRARRYVRKARRWATVTPAVLDRFPKNKKGQDEAAIIARACRNIGLPSPTEIELHKHSALRAAPSVGARRGERTAPAFTFPQGSALARRPLRHLVVTFARPVEGPVILGAGRFQGLGLCLPLAEEAGS